ncbi:MAG TPA: oligosaccharide flippase family protein [Verrucomicrobiae bacterium]|nr:oligosaccharide flippase family protein [Verrucomicrobiae bacterium]
MNGPPEVIKDSPPGAVRSWFARFLERETVRYFLGQGLYLFPLNFLGLVLGFVSTVLYARFLSADQYGEYSYVFATATLLNFLSLPGLGTAIAQATAQDFDGVYPRATHLRQRFSLLGSVVIAGVGIACWKTKGTEVMWAFFLAAILFPLYYATDTFWSMLTGKKRFGTLSLFRLIQMLAVAGMTWFTLVSTQRVPLVFAANFGTMGLTNLAFYLWTRRLCQNDRVNPKSFGYGQRLSALSVLMSAEARADHVMVGTFLPFHELGWFQMGDRISDALMKGTWTITSQLLFPRLAEVSAAEARRRVRAWGVYLLVVFAVLAAGFWMVAPWLLPWILGSKYLQSVRLARWLVLIALIGVPWSLFEVYCQARADEKGLWITRLTVAATHLGTMPLLLKWWGLLGVLVSLAMSRVVCVIVCVVLFRKKN